MFVFSKYFISDIQYYKYFHKNLWYNYSFWKTNYLHNNKNEIIRLPILQNPTVQNFKKAKAGYLS